MKMKLRLTKKQKAFIDAKESEVLFGGAAGPSVRWLMPCSLP